MSSDWKSSCWQAALIIVLTAIVRLPGLRAGFSWDDDVLITRNPLVQASDGLYRFWLTTEAPDYYPLTSSLWWLEWRWWGDSPKGYHVVNTLLHAANAVLVWIALRQLKIPGAWVAGLVFAVHPVNVATVAWISEQKNTLSMLFCVVTVLLYLRFYERRHWTWYGFALVTFLLAVLSKSAVVMLPVVLLACVWWRQNRVSRKDILYSLPFFLLSLILGVVTVWFQYNRVLQGKTIRTDDFLSRLATAGTVPWFYASKALVPFNLNAVYPKWNIDASEWTSYVPGALLIGGFAFFWWKRSSWGRAALFGLGYFVVMLFPVLGFFDQAYYQVSFVADHWQYYSIVGVIALSVTAVHRFAGGTGKQRSGLVKVIGVAMVSILAAASFERSRVYADQERLWGDSATKNPTAWLAYNGLGLALANSGKIEVAISHYEHALRLRPDYADAHNNLGVALTKLGNVPAAVEHYEQALRIKADYADAHYNLGIALWQTSRLKDAIQHYEEALRIRPHYAEAHSNLAVALAHEGRIQDAIRHWEQALRINPGFAEAHYNLGVALEAEGNIADAVSHYRQTLRIKPDLVEAQNRLTRLQPVKQLSTQ